MPVAPSAEARERIVAGDVTFDHLSGRTRGRADELVLQPVAGREDPAELYRTFMGRDPDFNALLERSGLLTETTV